MDHLIIQCPNTIVFALSIHLVVCKVQVSVDQRQRLAMSTERLNQSSDRIMESRRTMLETEEVGVSILQDLHHQRDSLLHSHKKVCH